MDVNVLEFVANERQRIVELEVLVKNLQKDLEECKANCIPIEDLKEFIYFHKREDDDLVMWFNEDTKNEFYDKYLKEDSEKN